MSQPVMIGVLALQGDFTAQIKAFESLGVSTCEVRKREQLTEIDGLVLPGGETTTMIKLLEAFELWEPLRQLAAAGVPIYGTCAGLVLLAREVTHPAQASLDLLPVSVERNSYGRQVDSFVASGLVKIPADLAPLISENGLDMVDTEFVFIRAPKITGLLGDLEVLARHDGVPVLVRRGTILGGSFHPEMIDDGVVLRLFIAMVSLARKKRPGSISSRC